MGLRLISGFLLLGICFLTIVLSLTGQTPGIRFRDEEIYLTGMWLMAEKGTICQNREDINTYQQHVFLNKPGIDDRIYAANPLGYSVALLPFYMFGGWLAALRANCFFSAFALVSLFFLCRYWFSSRTVLAALILFSVSPIFVLYTTLAMNHSLTIFIQAIGLILCLKHGRFSRVFRFCAGLLLGLGVSIRLDFVLMVIPATVLILVPLNGQTGISKPFRFRNLKYAVWDLIWVWAGFALGALPQIFYGIHCFGHFMHSGYDPRLAGPEVISLNHTLTAIPRIFFRINKIGLPLVFGPGILGLTILCFRRQRVALHILAWILPYFILYSAFQFGSKHDFNMRYFLPLFPGLACCAIELLNHFNLSTKRHCWLLVVFLSASTMVGAWKAYFLVNDRDANVKSQYAVMQYVDTHLPRNAVFFTPKKIGLLFALKNIYDIRNIDFLVSQASASEHEIVVQSPLPSSRENNQGKIPMLIQRSKLTVPQKRETLNRLWKDNPNKPVYLIISGIRSDYAEIVRRDYNVTVKEIYSTPQALNNYLVFKIESLKN